MLNQWRTFLVEDVLAPQTLWAYGRTLIYVVVVMVAAQLAVKFADLIIRRAFDLGCKDEDQEKQRKTLKGVTRSVVRYTINFIAIMTVLAHLGIDTTQLLAGAGILGLAVGFGAQSLVRDFLSGFFILYENQVAVGEYVDLGGVSGTVHEIRLRTTVIKDFGGQYHYVPNGNIGNVTNYSRGEMRLLVEVEVAYEEDLDRVFEVLTEVCDAMAEESEDIVEGPRVLGVNALGASGVTVMLWGRSVPGSQWGLARELRLRAKKALDAAGLEIPYPRRVVVPAHLTSVDRGGRTREP